MNELSACGYVSISGQSFFVQLSMALAIALVSRSAALFGCSSVAIVVISNSLLTTVAIRASLEHGARERLASVCSMSVYQSAFFREPCSPVLVSRIRPLVGAYLDPSCCLWSQLHLALIQVPLTSWPRLFRTALFIVPESVKLADLVHTDQLCQRARDAHLCSRRLRGRVGGTPRATLGALRSIAF